MADRSNERGGWPREHRLDPRHRHDWDEAAADYQAGEDDRPGEGRSFEKGYVGPRYGVGGYTGYTGGYGQNGSDPGNVSRPTVTASIMAASGRPRRTAAMDAMTASRARITQASTVPITIPAIAAWDPRATRAATNASQRTSMIV
uniref:Uncharacterized protein n=1 Tax=Phenylobacterium glaciei TaxID=2803784 RepID=A0A974P0B9_9CAUL|nr:hypothetical protein JKL49_14515 [Phenylobacterium glaciei]